MVKVSCENCILTPQCISKVINQPSFIAHIISSKTNSDFIDAIDFHWHIYRDIDKKCITEEMIELRTPYRAIKLYFIKCLTESDLGNEFINKLRILYRRYKDDNSM